MCFGAFLGTFTVKKICSGQLIGGFLDSKSHQSPEQFFLTVKAPKNDPEHDFSTANALTNALEVILEDGVSAG